MNVHKLRTVLFDLDGTLADTAPDLAAALNKVIADEGRAPLPFATIRPWVSHGANALIRLGFNKGPNDVDFAELRSRLLSYYAADVCRATRVFPGVPELLATLRRRDIGWGIVTNKPGFLTDPLVAQLNLVHPPACVVSGDTTQNRKPHPEPLLHACTLADARPAECLYVGDAERDIQAGRDAGMKTLVALFGYIGADESPAQWGADGMVQAPLEILEWIDGH
ncbi:MAG: phosphoglycolate phosphatase [Gammaproteobacteria bacterium]|nr:phosphoglycolate phosphatase [Gammaproteobacteria bacterium]